MDNYREVELLPVKSVGASGTETVDIAVDEPLTALYVYFRAVNEAAVADEAPPERCIDKIEIVDGGKVYYSCTGPEAVAAAVYDTGQWPSHYYDEFTSRGQFISIPLLFGLHIGDEQYAFSPGALLNPQIKITWTHNALHTAAGYQLGVRVKAMQGVAAPRWALMTKNIRSFVSGGSGIEGTELPVDLDIRRLYINAFKLTRYWAEMLTHLKLDCDVGKLIMLDTSAARFLDMLKETFPQVSLGSTVCFDDGVWKEGWLGNIMGAGANAISPGVFVNAWSAFAGRYWQWSETDAGAASNDQVTQLRLFGYLPHTVLAYQFGRPNDPASWFKPSRYGQVKLDLTLGEAGVPVGILLQRPTPLP